MSTTFLTVGKLSINPARVTFAEWEPDPANPDALAGTLHVSTGIRTFHFPFADPGVVEAAAALGLGEHAAEHTKAVKAKDKAAKDAEHAAAKAAETEHKAAAASAAHKAHG